MPQSFAITLGAAARRWPVWTQLAKRKIAAKDGQTGFTERGRQRHQERELAICSGTVSEDEAIVGMLIWNVEKAANGGFAEVVTERRYVRLAHRSKLIGCTRKAVSTS
jgi:hypothetical protein